MAVKQEPALKNKLSIKTKIYQPVGHDTDYDNTVKILNIGPCMSEQTVKILIRLLLRSSLIRIYTVCRSFYIFWRHYFIVKFILRITTVAGLGVPIFRVFTVLLLSAEDILIHWGQASYLYFWQSTTKPLQSARMILCSFAQSIDWNNHLVPTEKMSPYDVRLTDLWLFGYARAVNFGTNVWAWT